MVKTRHCASMAVLVALATAAPAAFDGIPFKKLTAFQTFRLSLPTPGYEIMPPPPNYTKYLQQIEFEQPARVQPTSLTVWMRYDPQSYVTLNVGPDQANKLVGHSWDISCHVQYASKLVVTRLTSGPTSPSSSMTFETPVVNDVATFTVPNYLAVQNAIRIATKPEYKSGSYFAWSFDYCDVKPVAKLKIVPPLTPKP